MNIKKRKYSEYRKNIKYVLNSEYLELKSLRFKKDENITHVFKGKDHIVDIEPFSEKNYFNFQEIISPFVDKESTFYKVMDEPLSYQSPEKTPTIVNPLVSHKDDEFAYTYIFKLCQNLALPLGWREHYALSDKQSTFRLDSFMTKFNNEHFYLFFKNPNDLQNDVFLKRSIIGMINKALHADLYDELENRTLDEIVEHFKMIKY